VSDLLPPVIATLIADTKEFNAKMDEAIGKMEEVDGASAESGAGIAAGLGLAGGAVAGLAVGIAGLSIDAAMNFQSAMTQVQNSAGLSAKQVKSLGDAFQGTMFTTEFSSTQIAQAYSGVAGQLELLNGKALTTNQAMGFVTETMDLATAKHLSLADAMSSVTSVMKSFQMPIAQAQSVTNALYVTSGLTGSSVDSLSGQFTKMKMKLGDVTPSVSDLDNLMVDMTEHGVGQGRALQTVSAAMTKLLDPSSKNVGLMEQLGVNAFNASGKFVGMQQVLAQLQPAFANMNQEQQIQTATTLFGAGAAQQMLTLIQAGPAAYSAAATAIQNHANVTQGAANASNNLHTQLETLKSGAQDLATQLGNALLPVATQVVGWLSTTGVKDLHDFTNAFDGKKIQGFAGTLGAESKSIIKSVQDIYKAVAPPTAGVIGFVNKVVTLIGFSKGLMSTWDSIANDVKTHAQQLTPQPTLSQIPQSQQAPSSVGFPNISLSGLTATEGQVASNLTNVVSNTATTHQKITTSNTHLGNINTGITKLANQKNTYKVKGTIK